MSRRRHSSLLSPTLPPVEENAILPTIRPPSRRIKPTFFQSRLVRYTLIGTCLLTAIFVLFFRSTDSIRYENLKKQLRIPKLSLAKSQPCPTGLPQNVTEVRRKLRILHFVDKETMDSVMDRWFFRSQVEFAKQVDLIEDAPIWGPGFPGYKDDLSPTKNIKLKYGNEGYFDAIMPYYNQDQWHHAGEDPVPYLFSIRDVSLHGTVVIDRPHEMRDGRRFPVIDHANVSLVLVPYPNEIYPEYASRTSKALFVHQPHPVEPSLFEHPIFDEHGRPADRPDVALLAGSIEPGLYPLRARLARMIEEGSLPGRVRKHPGYPDIMPLEQRIAAGINTEFMDNQLKEFSQDLSKAKICFITASRWQYSIQKYGEAAAAGCLIMGTLPADRREDFSRFVVEISNQDSDQKLKDLVNHWLVHEEDRLEKTRIAQEYFLRYFTGRKYVEDVVEWIYLVKNGKKGAMFPHTFSPLPSPLPDDG